MGSTLTSHSAGFFSLSQQAVTSGQITVSSPAGNESWQPGSNHLITWENTGTPAAAVVKIELLTESDVSLVIAENVTNTGRYSWTIPDTIKISSSYRIKVTGIDQDSVGLSPKYFTISPATTALLTLTISPTAGGTVTPSAPTTLDTGKAQSITATPNTNYKFVRWVTDSNARVTSSLAPTTSCSLNNNATVTAVMALKEDLKSLTIKMRTDKQNKDSVDIKNAEFAIGDISGFDINSDTVTIIIDSIEFQLLRDKGTYSQSGKKEIYTYKTDKDILPKVNFKLDLVKTFGQLRLPKLIPYLLI